MGKEIERKFLVNGDKYRENSSKTYYKQGYLSVDKERTVRIRIAGNKGFITIKGKTTGCSRQEYEYEIPVTEAENIIWEIDEFMGENAGLTVAEIELPTEDSLFTKPDWIGQEVTDDTRFYNSNLIRNPFKRWKNNK